MTRSQRLDLLDYARFMLAIAGRYRREGDTVMAEGALASVHYWIKQTRDARAFIAC